MLSYKWNTQEKNTMIITLLHLSDSHLDDEAREAYKELADINNILWVNDSSNYSDQPEDLFNVIEFAISLNISYLLIDKWGTIVSQLPSSGI
jgi:hypothetical protein